MRHRSALGIAAFLIPLLSGLANPQSGRFSAPNGLLNPPPISIKTLSEEMIQQTFERPMTTEALLINLRLAISRDLLLQESLFKEKTLRKFLNAKSVKREESVPLVVFYTPATYRGRVSSENIYFPNTTGSVRFNRRDSRPSLSGVVTLEFERRFAPTVREVQDIFGADAQFSRGDYSPHGTFTPTVKGSYTYELRGEQTDAKRSVRRYFKKLVRFTVSLNGPVEPSTEGKVTILSDNSHPSPTDSVSAISIQETIDEF